MWLSRVLLPHPLPPMITKISPRSIVKERSCWMTKLPYAIVRSATAIRGSGVVGLEVEDIQDHGKNAVDDDDEDDRRDHRGRRREPNRGGAPARLHASEAADERDEDAEHAALDHTDEKVRQVHGAA